MLTPSSSSSSSSSSIRPDYSGGPYSYDLTPRMAHTLILHPVGGAMAAGGGWGYNRRWWAGSQPQDTTGLASSEYHPPHP